MKVLVTGGLGFIGSHVVVELQQEGFEVVIIDKGHGFNPQNPPKITIVGGKGNGAECESVIDDDGFLSLIKIKHPGNLYTETPNVIIEPPLMNSSCHFCCK